MNRQRQGFTLVEIMVVVTVIGMLAAIGVPAYSRAREKSITNQCLVNLKQITDAKDQYAFDHYNTAPTALTDFIPDYLVKAPECHGGGSYTIGDLGEDASCNVSNHTL